MIGNRGTKLTTVLVYESFSCCYRCPDSTLFDSARQGIGSILMGGSGGGNPTRRRNRLGSSGVAMSTQSAYLASPPGSPDNNKVTVLRVVCVCSNSSSIAGSGSCCSLKTQQEKEKQTSAQFEIKDVNVTRSII